MKDTTKGKIAIAVLPVLTILEQLTGWVGFYVLAALYAVLAFVMVSLTTSVFLTPLHIRLKVKPGPAPAKKTLAEKAWMWFHRLTHVGVIATLFAQSRYTTATIVTLTFVLIFLYGYKLKLLRAKSEEQKPSEAAE